MINRNILFIIAITVGISVTGIVLFTSNNIDDVTSLSLNYEYVPTPSSEYTISENNDFAFDFYRQIIKENDDNVFFSPWSIFVAFGIVYEGASSDALVQIAEVFGFSADEKKRHEGFESVINSMNSENSKYELQTANALWIADFIEPHSKFVNSAKENYHSKVSKVDFISNDGVDKINKWVSDQTNDKIKDILAPDSTNELTRVAITNAIYFKGTWVTQFDKSDTRDRDFHLNSTEKVKTPMMLLDASPFNYLQEDEFQVLEMPYDGDRLSMIVVLPIQIDGIKDIEENLTSQNLKQWKENMQETKVIVVFPKFKMETNYDLINPLIELGMPTPFDENVRDNFKNITDEDYLYISQAIHKAFVDVNEEGTEAAAATAVVIMRESAGPSYPVFHADHPFVFMIQDNETGSILFVGKVADPTA